jgi:hypothetical protein
MKYKFNENSKKVLHKLHKEGILSSFVKSIEKSIRGQSDRDIEKMMKKKHAQHAKFVKQIKKDPVAAADQILKDLGY